MEWYYELVKCSEVETNPSKINLQDLPQVVIEKIFSYLSYNQIAENRLVSRLFNQVGSEMLNRGFYMVERYHRKCLKAFKSKLPRRESERKVHPLSRQCDILVAIETRLSMLTMTFVRYIDAGQCCFIPGKVLDELLRVLRYVNYCSSPPHDLLQELRDITSMAMEHFDEKIVPHLKEKLAAYRASSRSSLIVDYVGSNNGSQDTAFTPRITTYKSLFNAVRQNLIRAKSNHNLITSISHKSRKIVKHARYTGKQIKLMKNKINEQGKEIQKLRRCILNWEAKFRDLSAEVRGISRRNGITSLPLPDESIDKDNKVEKAVTRSTKKRKL